MAAKASKPPDGSGAILQLGALALRDRLASGALRAVELAAACLDRIAEREERIQAWAWIDRDHALRQAEALDRHRSAGRPVGPLHGLPVGIKDIIDTAGIATENGTPIDSGRVPQDDAFVVARLKQAGALILGKTVTTELAFLDPSRTRNPNDPEHTPGGSSAGSAAAVADAMVPLAVGTQTGGSVIRPAAYCGVTGFKPSFGAIPRTGILPQAPSLDTVGVFGRGIEDVALLAEALCGHDPGDPATAPVPPPPLLATALSEPPVTPALAFVRQPVWDDAEQDTKDAFAELTETLGELCAEVALPTPFAEAAQLRQRVNFAEMAKCYYGYERRGRDRIGPEVLAAIDAGKQVPARDYLAARDWPGVLTAGLDEIFDRFDAIITPAAPGAAPAGLKSTGSPAFNGLWTFCGTPAVTVPLLAASNGLPMGVQLVGRRGDDARLLRTARWLIGHLTAAGRD